MLFLVPLALSLLSTGYGIYQGAVTNDQLARQGREQADRQIEENEIAVLAQDAAIRRALAAANQAEIDAREQAKKTTQTYQVMLYLVAGSLLVLTVWMLVKRQQWHHRVNLN
jgi:uncharacterized membrane protein YidH (DUF202 family)